MNIFVPFSTHSSPTRRAVAHRLEVGPRIGFGHRDGGDLPAGDEVGHQARLLLRRARVVQVRRRHVGVHEHRDREAAVGRAAEFLGEHDGRQRVEIAAAVIRIEADAEQAQLAHVPEDITRHEALRFPGVGVRQHAVRDESADGVAQQLVVVGEEGIAGRRVHRWLRGVGAAKIPQARRAARDGDRVPATCGHPQREESLRE
jgi:hypothetical protein